MTRHAAPRLDTVQAQRQKLATVGEEKQVIKSSSGVDLHQPSSSLLKKNLEAPFVPNAAPSMSSANTHKSIVLPPEPGPDDGPTVLCKFRVPGGNLTRRFLTKNSVGDIFSFLRYNSTEGGIPALNNLCEEGKIIQLSTRFPTRIVNEKDVLVADGTLISDFETSNQIDFFVSSINS